MHDAALFPPIPRSFAFSSGIFIPARLDAGQTAKVLGFNEHDIPVLVGRSLLEPLGRPAENSRKYFARAEVLRLSEDINWLGKATRFLSQHWQEKNSKRKVGGEGETSHSE